MAPWSMLSAFRTNIPNNLVCLGVLQRAFCPALQASQTQEMKRAAITNIELAVWPRGSFDAVCVYGSLCGAAASCCFGRSPLFVCAQPQ